MRRATRLRRETKRVEIAINVMLATFASALLLFVVIGIAMRMP